MKFLVFVWSVQALNAFYFNANAYYYPHPEKEHKGGEDALLVEKELLVIADGVGGWEKQGIAPEGYSRNCINLAQHFYKQDKEKYISNPKQLTLDVQRNNNEKGSSTFLALMLERNILKVNNMGDCQYMILRKDVKDQYRIIHRSKDQQLSFNYPFQIAVDMSQNGFSASDSQVFSHELQKGDLVIVGSDGLWDNLYDNQFLFYIKDMKTEKELRETLPRKLAEFAIQKGKALDYYSPFAKNAKDAGLNYGTGGKLDDTAVIVAIIDDVYQPSFKLPGDDGIGRDGLKYINKSNEDL